MRGPTTPSGYEKYSSTASGQRNGIGRRKGSRSGPPADSVACCFIKIAAGDRPCFAPTKECPRHTVSAIQLAQQLVRAPQVRNDNAAAHHQRHVDRIFLLGTRHAQPVGLNQVEMDAVVAAQAR